MSLNYRCIQHHPLSRNGFELRQTMIQSNDYATTSFVTIRLRKCSRRERAGLDLRFLAESKELQLDFGEMRYRAERAACYRVQEHLIDLFGKREQRREMYLVYIQ